MSTNWQLLPVEGERSSYRMHRQSIGYATGCMLIAHAAQHSLLTNHKYYPEIHNHTQQPNNTRVVLSLIGRFYLKNEQEISTITMHLFLQVKLWRIHTKSNKKGTHNCNEITTLDTNLHQQVIQQQMVVPCQNHWSFCCKNS